MGARAFEVVVRRAAAVLDRRSVLGILTVAVLAALTPVADAGRGRRKKNKKKGKRSKNGRGGCEAAGIQCLNDRDAFCEDAFPGDEFGAQDCVAAHTPCCTLAGQSKFDEAQTCVDDYRDPLCILEGIGCPPPQCKDDGDGCRNAAVEVCADFNPGDPQGFEDCQEAKLVCCRLFDQCRFDEGNLCFANAPV